MICRFESQPFRQLYLWLYSTLFLGTYKKMLGVWNKLRDSALFTVQFVIIIIIIRLFDILYPTRFRCPSGVWIFPLHSEEWLFFIQMHVTFLFTRVTLANWAWCCHSRNTVACVDFHIKYCVIKNVCNYAYFRLVRSTWPRFDQDFRLPRLFLWRFFSSGMWHRVIRNSLNEVIPLCIDSIYSLYWYIFQATQLYYKGVS